MLIMVPREAATGTHMGFTEPDMGSCGNQLCFYGTPWVMGNWVSPLWDPAVSQWDPMLSLRHFVRYSWE